MDPVAPAAPTPVRPALSMDSLVAHVQHLKEPLEQIRREVDTWLFFLKRCRLPVELVFFVFFLGRIVVSSPFFGCRLKGGKRKNK